MTRHLFVYGSLLDPESASKALGVNEIKYQSDSLGNAKLRFNVPYDVQVNGRVFSADFLNLSLGHGLENRVYGALIEVTIFQLDQLRLREKEYSLVDVKTNSGRKALTFVSVKPRGGNNVVLDEYLKKIKDGAKKLGLELYCKISRQLKESVESRVIVYGKYKFLDDRVNELTNV